MNMSQAEVFPTQITVEWEVENFFDLPLDDGYGMRTRPFPFAKGQYCLQLRPNGDKIHNSAGWTSLCLIKICSTSEDRIAFIVGAKKADGSIFRSVEGVSIFAKAFSRYRGAISLRSELFEHKNEVAPDGNLTLFFSARLNSDGVKAVASQTAPSDNTLETLSENLKNLFISGSQGDIKIKAKDKDFTAHRSILAARSSVFQAKLEADVLEKNNGVITIEDCDSDCVESFLFFLYSGDLAVVPASHAQGLYYLADKYNMPELKRACSQCLARDLSIDTVCEVARLATLHSETELLDTAADFFYNNMNDIVSTPKWTSFLVENPLIGNELFVKVANRLKDLRQKM